MDYQEFLNKLQKRGSKPHRLKHCLGSRDAFHWVRKNKWKALGGAPCDKLLYSKIISEVNKQLLEMLLEGHEIEFPYQMGSLLVNRTPAKVRIVDGVIETNYKINWKKTLQFLYEDKEALEEHKRIKNVNPYIYSIRYYKRKAVFLNKRFYYFRINRSLRKKLGLESVRCELPAEQIEY